MYSIFFLGLGITNLVVSGMYQRDSKVERTKQLCFGLLCVTIGLAIPLYKIAAYYYD